MSDRTRVDSGSECEGKRNNCAIAPMAPRPQPCQLTPPRRFFFRFFPRTKYCVAACSTVVDQDSARNHGMYDSFVGSISHAPPEGRPTPIIAPRPADPLCISHRSQPLQAGAPPLTPPCTARRRRRGIPPAATTRPASWTAPGATRTGRTARARARAPAAAAPLIEARRNTPRPCRRAAGTAPTEVPRARGGGGFLLLRLRPRRRRRSGGGRGCRGRPTARGGSVGTATATGTAPPPRFQNAVSP